MLHPAQLTPDQKRDMRSELMKTKQKMTTGEVVNACPFGCNVEDLDENGYCGHLVGFTADKKGYEPMVLVGNQRRVQVATKIIRGKVVPQLEPLKKGDKLVRITTSYRVYRDVPGVLAEDREEPMDEDAFDESELDNE